MKRREFFKYLGITSFAFAVRGCQDFLDVVPDEKASLSDAFESANNAKDFLFSVYHFLPKTVQVEDGIDLTTADEVVNSNLDEPATRMKIGNYSPNNLIISNFDRLYAGIRQAYILINNIDTVPDLSTELKVQYKAEAKFLIGYFYFRLIRAYGPVVIHKDVADINKKSSKFKKRSPLMDCVKFVTNILDEAAQYLPQMHSGSDFGRGTSVLAISYKARMLFYAASPLFNGGGKNKNSLYTDFKDNDEEQLIPTTYERQKWVDAASALKEAIEAAESAGFKLYKNSSVKAPYPSDPTEKDLRFTICDPQSDEIMFVQGWYNQVQTFSAIRHQPVTSHSYSIVCPTLQRVELFYSENGLPIDVDPDYDYDNRYSVVNGTNGPTMAVNLNREPRFNAWIAYHNGYYELAYSDKNRIICKFRSNDPDGKRGRQEGYPATGYLNKKGVHPLTRGDSDSIVDFPWSYLRLGKLYLDYAEALIETGKINFDEAKTYIDKIRTRAGIPEVDKAWKPIGGADDKETLRSIVRRERTIELYFENERFWDLRRWMMGEKLDIDPKGMNTSGVTTKDFFQVKQVYQNFNFESPTDYLLPIPFSEVLNNPNIVQNVGY
jgi:hypothetical protein